MKNKKTCPSCEKEKTLSDFHRCKKSKDGHKFVCKSCRNRKNKLLRFKKSMKANMLTPVGYKQPNPNRWQKCKTCKTKKPIEKFSKSNRHTLGVMKECSKCLHQSRKKYQTPESMEKIAIQRKEYKEKNKDLIKEKNLEYRKENKEKIKKAQEAYRLNNPEKVKSSKKRWEINNPEKVAEKRFKRRILEKQSIPEWSESDKIKNVYEKAKWLGSLTGLKYHVDHIVPINGKEVCGLHVWANLQILEASINCAKGNRVL